APMPQAGLLDPAEPAKVQKWRDDGLLTEAPADPVPPCVVSGVQLKVVDKQSGAALTAALQRQGNSFVFQGSRDLLVDGHYDCRVDVLLQSGMTGYSTDFTNVVIAATGDVAWTVAFTVPPPSIVIPVEIKTDL